MSETAACCPAPSPSVPARSSLPPTLHWLRLTGLVEGTSTLALFGVAMPLKYAAGMPLAVTVVGGIHGVLFLVYVAMIVLALVRHRWPLGRGVALFIASIVPFGPFVMDRRIPRWHAADQAKSASAPA